MALFLKARVIDFPSRKAAWGVCRLLDVVDEGCAGWLSVWVSWCVRVVLDDRLIMARRE